MSRRDEVKEELLKTDDEFRRLHEEHQSCKRRLAALRLKSFPSPEDEVEEKKIKVHKLQLKDRMEVMIRTHSQATILA